MSGRAWRGAAWARAAALAAGVLLALVALSGAAALQLTLTVRYPTARRVFVRGDGCGLSWASGVPAARAASPADAFVVELQCAAGEARLLLKALLDDSLWEIGANHAVALGGGGGGGGDVKAAVFPFFFSARGRYALQGGIASPQLQNTRESIVYFPPSYDENPYKTYPLLVMHDGQNLFNDSTSFLGMAWRCQDTVDLQVAEGNMEEVLILGLYNTDDRTDEYTYSYDASVGAGGKGDLYLDFIEQQVLPLAQQRYRVHSLPASAGAAARASGAFRAAILGSSLGGLISCYAAWTRPAVFAVAGCMSSSFWWNNDDFLGTVLPAHVVTPATSTFYLDSGDSGPGQDDEAETIAVRKYMQAHDFALNSSLYYYLDQGGQHNEYYWGKRFYVPMTELFGAPQG